LEDRPQAYQEEAPPLPEIPILADPEMPPLPDMPAFLELPTTSYTSFGASPAWDAPKTPLPPAYMQDVALEEELSPETWEELARMRAKEAEFPPDDKNHSKTPHPDAVSAAEEEELYYRNLGDYQ